MVSCPWVVLLLAVQVGCASISDLDKLSQRKDVPLVAKGVASPNKVAAKNAVLAPTEMPPVVLVHGIDDTSEKMAPIDRYLESRGWRHRRRFDMIPSDGAAGLAILSDQLADVVADAAGLTPLGKVDLVAFSMGAIVSRHFLQLRGGAARIRVFISISGPHRGTWTGFMRQNGAAREMRVGSPFLADLNRDVSLLRRIRCYSLWTPYDLMILPADSSRVSWAQNFEFPVFSHPWMVADSRVFHAIARLLKEAQ